MKESVQVLPITTLDDEVVFKKAISVERTDSRMDERKRGRTYPKK